MLNIELVKLLADCKKSGSLEPLEKMLEKNGNGNSDGKAVKLVMYRDENGEIKMNVISISEYRDLEKMSLQELKAYLKELEDESEAIDDAEPDDEDSAEYRVWEQKSDEIDDEIYRVEDEIDRRG